MAGVAIRSGRLRYPGTIQRAVETENDIGETERSWVTLLADRFEVQPMTQRAMERLAGAQLQQDITHVVRRRYSPSTNVKTKDRILFHDGRIFEIQSIVDVEEHNRVNEMFCKEVVNG